MSSMTSSLPRPPGFFDIYENDSRLLVHLRRWVDGEMFGFASLFPNMLSIPFFVRSSIRKSAQAGFFKEDLLGLISNGSLTGVGDDL